MKEPLPPHNGLTFPMRPFCLQKKTRINAQFSIYYCLSIRDGDLDTLVQQVRAQLKKIAITDKTRVDEMFLRYNTDRTGYIDALNMRDLLKRLQLPADDDVVNSVSF